MSPLLKGGGGGIGGFAGATEITQLSNNLLLANELGIETESLNQLMREYKQIEQQTNHLMTLQRQFSNFPQSWGGAEMLTYLRRSKTNLRQIQGLTWAAADTSNRLNKKYPLWKARNDFEEEYRAMAETQNEAIKAVMEDQHEQSVDQEKVMTELENINNLANSAEGQTQMLSVIARLLATANNQLVQLNKTTANQLSLFSNYYAALLSQEGSGILEAKNRRPIYDGPEHPEEFYKTNFKMK